jgi:hypothetical protein
MRGQQQPSASDWPTRLINGFVGGRDHTRGGRGRGASLVVGSLLHDFDGGGYQGLACSTISPFAFQLLKEL